MSMLTLKRRDDWRAHLLAYLAEVKATPLNYGGHDCGVGLVARAVEAMTGVDLAAQWRGRYDSARGALRMLRDDGYADLETLGRSMLPAFHPSLGQIGDIALVRDDGLGALGIVQGERIIVMTETGLGSVDLLAAKLIFRVGDAR
ncbi:UNVERIFIED_ORG: hypothetical protein LHK14_18055 [Roseateles sp. XES5]|nr:hypothetical protein [Roseateles sp. XES5]